MFLLGMTVALALLFRIRSGDYIREITVIKGEQWFVVPARFRIPLFVATGVTVGSILSALLHLISISGITIEEPYRIYNWFALILGFYTYILETNQPLTSTQKSTTILVSVILGAAISMSFIDIVDNVIIFGG